MKTVLFALVLAAAVPAHAQSLPPVFGGQTAKTDGMDRAYLTPKRIVWTQGRLQHQDVLLSEGTFPTPLGAVSIRREKKADGSIATTVDAPAGITVMKE